MQKPVKMVCFAPPPFLFLTTTLVVNWLQAEASGEMPTHSSSAASSQHSGQYEIPRELQEVLLDFTVHYLIEQVWSLGRYFMSVSKVSHDQRERRPKMYFRPNQWDPLEWDVKNSERFWTLIILLSLPWYYYEPPSVPGMTQPSTLWNSRILAGHLKNPWVGTSPIL